MNPQRVYVECAVSAMRLAKSEQELIEWWNGERPNRQQLNLSPDQDPGLRLNEAFKDKRLKLKGTRK